jgi:hypothetical protein
MPCSVPLESHELVGDSFPGWLVLKLRHFGIQFGSSKGDKNLGRSEHGRAEKRQCHPKMILHAGTPERAAGG